jgi:hypothetical protein
MARRARAWPSATGTILSTVVERVGASVLVFFDPAAPDNCTLESSFDWLSWMPVILFALIIILGCIFDFGRGY